MLVYATGQEGRGVGLVNKLRAYVLQENGYDTVDANHLLGFPADGRDYAEAAQCLALVGVRSVRLLTSNPRKVEGLRRNGIEVDEVVSAATVAPRPKPHVPTVEAGPPRSLRRVGGSAGDDRGSR